MSRAGAAVLIVPVLAAAACGLDDRPVVVRPDPITVGTFESTSLMPDDARFNRWGSVVYNTDLAMRQYRISPPGYQSGSSLELSYAFRDPPDGISNYPDALIRTQALASLDLTQYQTFSFVERVEQGLGSCKPLQAMRVVLVCYEDAASFQVAVPVGADWAVNTIALTDFAEPSYNVTGVPWQDCLSRVDEVQFITSYGLTDGQCAAGTLRLDDIVIR